MDGRVVIIKSHLKVGYNNDVIGLWFSYDGGGEKGDFFFIFFMNGVNGFFVG